MRCVYALISIQLVRVNTRLSFALTVRWSIKLPQRASSNPVTFSGSFSTALMNLSNSRLRMRRNIGKYDRAWQYSRDEAISEILGATEGEA